MTMPEANYWPAVTQAWHARARELRLKPGTKGYINQQEAFLQGALAVATATGAMTMDRAQMLAFLVMCGRIDSILKPEEKQDKAAATTAA